MPRFSKQNAPRIRPAEARNHAAEIGSELSFREQQLQARQSLNRGCDLIRAFAEARCELAQQPVDLPQFLFAQTDQLVIELNGLQRLYEHGVAAAARSMDYSVDAALASGDDRNHEAIVADGHEIFLKRAVFLVRAQEALERGLDQVTLDRKSTRL